MPTRTSLPFELNAAIPREQDLIPEPRRLRLRRWTVGFVIALVVASAIVLSLVANAGTPSRSVSGSAQPGPHASHSVVAHWTELTSAGTGLPAGAQITALTQYDGLYVASGNYFGGEGASTLAGCPSSQCNPVVWTSTNGSHWKIVFAESAQGSVAGEQLIVTPHGLFMFNSDETTELWHSVGGHSWSSITLPTGMSALSLTSAAWGHGRLVALFSNKYAGSENRAYGASDTIWTSENGETWHEDAVPGAWSFQSLAVSGLGFVVGGESKMTGASMVWRSRNGLHWSRTEFTPAHGTLNLAAYGDNLVAEVSASGQTNVEIWRSTGNQTWTRAVINNGPIPEASPGVTSLFSTSTGFVAVGNSIDMTWSSATGRTWNLVQTQAAPTEKDRLLRFFSYEYGGLSALVASARSTPSASALTTSLWRINLKNAR